MELMMQNRRMLDAMIEQAVKDLIEELQTGQRPKFTWRWTDEQ